MTKETETVEAYNQHIAIIDDTLLLCQAELETAEQTLRKCREQISICNYEISDNNVYILAMANKKKTYSNHISTLIVLCILVIFIVCIFFSEPTLKIIITLLDVFLTAILFANFKKQENSAKLQIKFANRHNEQQSEKINHLFQEEKEHIKNIESCKANISELAVQKNDFNKKIKLINQKVEKLAFTREYMELFSTRYSYMPSKEAIEFIAEHSGVRRLVKDLAEFHHSTSYTKKRILTKSEDIFYNKLVVVSLAFNCYVYPHVNLSDIVEIGSLKNSGYNPNWLSRQIKFYENFIGQKHIDFVLVEGDNIKLCIELDDASHYDFNNQYFDEDHVRRNLVKDILLAYCGIPLLRIDDSETENLSSIIKNAIDSKGVTYEYSLEHKNMLADSINQLMLSKD